MNAFDSSPGDAESPLASPCVGLCQLGPRAACLGCGRVIDEIAGWSRATPEQKREIRRRAAQRLREAGT